MSCPALCPVPASHNINKTGLCVGICAMICIRVYARGCASARIPAALKDGTYRIKLRSKVACTNILCSIKCILVHRDIHPAMQVVLLLPSESTLLSRCRVCPYDSGNLTCSPLGRIKRCICNRIVQLSIFKKYHNVPYDEFFYQ